MNETVYRLPVPFSVALLTDLHNTPFSGVEASLLRHRPEVICVAGDVIYGRMPGLQIYLTQAQEHVLPFLRMCAGTAPTFFSLGNHEISLCDGDLSLIRETGVHLLDNCWEEYRGVFIGGLTSHYSLDYRVFRKGKAALYPAQSRFVLRAVRGPDTSWLADFEAQPGYKILLSHHPEYYPKYLRGRSIDLILSGHAHGGQWSIWGQGIYAPGQGLFPKLSSGVHDGRLVISRGLTNTAPVPRFGNPTEIVYLLPSNQAVDAE